MDKKWCSYCKRKQEVRKADGVWLWGGGGCSSKGEGQIEAQMGFWSEEVVQFFP